MASPSPRPPPPPFQHCKPSRQFIKTKRNQNPTTEVLNPHHSLECVESESYNRYAVWFGPTSPMLGHWASM
jgi:hypothetical protein